MGKQTHGKARLQAQQQTGFFSTTQSKEQPLWNNRILGCSFCHNVKFGHFPFSLTAPLYIQRGFWFGLFMGFLCICMHASMYISCAFSVALFLVRLFRPIPICMFVLERCWEASLQDACKDMSQLMLFSRGYGTTERIYKEVSFS